ncbi:MAG: phospholipase [Acidobacteriota bacterium]
MTPALFGLLASAIALAWLPSAAADGSAAEGRLRARPVPPAMTIGPGEHRIGLAKTGRDATLYIPQHLAPQRPTPLLLMLHGAGSSARNVGFIFPLAEQLGVVVLAPDSRRGTWDGVGGIFGPDVAFIDAALRYTFERVAVDPARLAIGGFSDGGSYALSLGLANGDLFTHLIAFSPGFITPAPPAGRPPIFVSHGTADQVLAIDVTSRQIVPQLRRAGYRVTYREFAGPHTVPAAVAREALEWLTR